MNILLWVLQVLLALHTVMGALWKLSNSEAAVPSLSMIPHAAWQGLSVLEVLFALGLVVPAFYRPLGMLVPLAAAAIGAEMLVFSGLHLSSGAAKHGEVVYWVVVAALCAFIAYGRFALKPLSRPEAQKAPLST